jgi:hypothetical protein
MIETVQIPILLKAIEILFDEGRKFLVERAERRKAAAQSRQQDQEPDLAVHPSPPEPDPEIKQDLLKSKIDELLWKNHEEEISHLVRLMETYSMNYHVAREQYAKWGSALVPPIVVHNMTEAENAMSETLQRLERVLSKVYRQDIRPAG